MRTVIVAAVPLLANSAFGHHSVAMFDQEQEVAIEGVVKELELVNPHSWFHVTVTGETAKAVDWSFEMQSVAILERQGWSPDLWNPGVLVTVFAHPLKDGSRGGQFIAMRLADGRGIQVCPGTWGLESSRWGREPGEGFYVCGIRLKMRADRSWSAGVALPT